MKTSILNASACLIDQAAQKEKRDALDEAEKARALTAAARDELSKLQARFNSDVKAALEKRAEKVAQLEEANAALQHEVGRKSSEQFLLSNNEKRAECLRCWEESFWSAEFVKREARKFQPV